MGTDHKQPNDTTVTEINNHNEHVNTDSPYLLATSVEGDKERHNNVKSDLNRPKSDTKCRFKTRLLPHNAVSFRLSA